MKKFLLFPVFILFLAIPASLFAQDSGFTPIVTQVKAEARNNLIRLTWVDSPDARGPVYIFRATRSFGSSIPANIRPVVVRYGEQYYVDDIDDLGNLYYFIAASDVGGRRYDIIIPQINTATINLLALAEPPELPAIAAAEPEPVQGISNLRARHDGGKIVISFDVSGPKKNALLYRSTQPIRQPQDLLNASMVQSGVSSPFTDLPVPGPTWYYAVIFEEDVSSGLMEIRPGMNATISAVSLSGERMTETAMRPIPLPVMTLDNAMNERYFLSDTSRNIPLSPDTERMLKNSQLPSKAPLQPRKPRIFTIDLQAPSGGEDSALFQILSEYFVKRDWEGARKGLQHYLSLPRSRDVEARARFYLGQTLYFSGNYRGALFEFLTIKSAHPVEANSWIDTVLAAMVH
jgi:hypothetical protein